MKPADRQLLIIDIIHQQGKVNVKELVSAFGISAETIRRDLSSLSATGRLQKTHGGAVLPGTIGEGSYQQRMRENVSAKRQIAKKACELIIPGDTLFIDTGSTTLTFAEELTSIDNLTVITNSTDIAKVISSNNSCQTILIGGQYDPDNRESIGPIAISQINQFRARHAILTIGGIHAKAGITNFNINEAHIARAMIEQSEDVIILADSTKIDQIAPFEVTPLNRLRCLVSNIDSQIPLDQALTKANVSILNASESS